MMIDNDRFITPATSPDFPPAVSDYGMGALLVRVLGWAMLGVLTVYLVNNFLTYWLNWPGAFDIAGGVFNWRSWVQTGFYGAAVGVAVFLVLRNHRHSLRTESRQITEISMFLVRAGFWAVLLVGLVDMAISFLRVEELLVGLAGKSLASDLALARFRGPYVHMPLIALAFLVAATTRTVGVPWLSLLIVVAELLIVIFRFVFSYEQVFMTDLVRFWYAALFLLACGYTLLDEGHVRVDILYVGLAPRMKGLVNAIGTVVLGIPFCWVILVIGTNGKTGIINSALLGFEITGTGYGLYVKYLMSAFPGVFAVLMLIQFVSYLFEAAADYLGEPGGRPHDAHIIQ